MSAISSVPNWTLSAKIPSITDNQIRDLSDNDPNSVETWNSRRLLAQSDAAILAERNVTHQQVAERLHDLINRATAIYNRRPKFNVGGSSFGEVVDQFIVKGIGECAKMMDDCVICPFELGGPSVYTIESRETNQSVKVMETTLHMIEEHHYFAFENTEWRVDPKQVCNVLSLQLF